MLEEFADPALSNRIDFITMSNFGSANDFGDIITCTAWYVSGLSNGTRGIFAGGNPQNQ